MGWLCRRAINTTKALEDGCRLPLLLKIRIPFCKSHQSHQSHQTLLPKKKLRWNLNITPHMILTWFSKPFIFGFHVVVVFWKSKRYSKQQRNFQRMTSCSCEKDLFCTISIGTEFMVPWHFAWQLWCSLRFDWSWPYYCLCHAPWSIDSLIRYDSLIM